MTTLRFEAVYDQRDPLEIHVPDDGGPPVVRMRVGAQITPAYVKVLDSLSLWGPWGHTSPQGPDDD